MKRKLLATLLISTMVLTTMLVGCGKKEVVEETVVTGTTTETTELGTNETTSTEVTTETNEVASAESTGATEAVVDDRFEDSMQKVHRVVEAYDAIMENGYELNMTIQSDIEKLENQTFYLDGYYFADDKVVEDQVTIYAIGIEYYNNYVNNNGEHYNMAEWMSKQSNNESVKSKYFTEAVGESYDTNNKLLMEAIAVANYLKNCKSVEGIELVETNEYTVNGIKSAYAIPLNCDGDTSLTAVFDNDNNLLQIWTPDGWDGYMFSFE